MGQCPLSIADLAYIHNMAVKCRDTETMPRGGLFVVDSRMKSVLPRWNEFVKMHKHRAEICSKLHRVEPVEPNGDRVPLMFLQRWEKDDDGQIQYITDEWVRSSRLLSDFELRAKDGKFIGFMSFASYYYNTWKQHRKPERSPEYRTPEELAQLCFLCMLEVRFLSGFDVQWMPEVPSPSHLCLENDSAGTHVRDWGVCLSSRDSRSVQIAVSNGRLLCVCTNSDTTIVAVCFVKSGRHNTQPPGGIPRDSEERYRSKKVI